MNNFSQINSLSGIKNKIEKETPADIASVYVSVIRKFINRADVQNGKAIGYRREKDKPAAEEDTPRMGVGQGLGTTGWCASASAALLSDPIFVQTLNFRGAKAKLISIDIKEVWYGKCYNGLQNKWHTAILVQDNNFNFVVDITCSQFSADFINKFVWDFKTWEATFRSPYCKHQIFDTAGNELSGVPIKNYIDGKKNDIEFAKVYDGMHDIISIDTEERKFMTEFFTVNLNILNEKLLQNNVSQLDFNYMEKVNGILEKFPFTQIKDGCIMLQFKTESELLQWYNALKANNDKLKQGLFVSVDLKNAYEYCTEDTFETSDCFNVEPNRSNKYYLVINIQNSFGIDSSFLDKRIAFLPYGCMLQINDTGLVNGGEAESTDPTLPKKHTNTYFMKASILI